MGKKQQSESGMENLVSSLEEYGQTKDMHPAQKKWTVLWASRLAHTSAGLPDLENKTTVCSVKCKHKINNR